MQNPWRLLPETSPFVLPCDREIIQNFNNRHRTKQVHQIHLELLPEPYLGNPQAKIVLLNGNPGYTEYVHIYHNNAGFARANRANLYHENQEYPFYLLNPQFEKSPGYEWWKKKLRQPIDEHGLKKIANEIFVIEYFPYPSKNFGFYTDIPSQKYSFYLLEEAMKRNALIIQMRTKKQWQKINPHLINYHRYYVLNNPQNVAISKNNCPNGYPEIRKVLEKTVL